MNARLQILFEKAKSAGDLAEGLAKEGVQNVSSAWQGVGLFRSLSALSVADLERDETHYLLVPLPSEGGAEAKFVLYSKRVIPEGYGAVNSLPKARIFHLPDMGAEARLREQLTSKLVQEKLMKGNEGVTTLAERLEVLAEDVDRETDKVSGGILVVGSAVALLNPVLGIGIMVSGVLPKIGGKLAKSGASLAGDQLRDWSAKRQEKRSAKEAVSEVVKLKPQVFVNPILEKLAIALTNPTGREDPLLEGESSEDGFPNHRYFRVSAEGVGAVYQDWLHVCGNSIAPGLKAWLLHLAEIGAASEARG